MIKRVLIFCLLLLTSTQLVFSQKSDKEPKAEIAFDKSTHDFGNIWDGASVEYSFEFSNKGNAPLILSNVQPSCGCTAPSWPREPIMPGKKAKIVVIYNPGGYRGNFSKTISVASNASNSNLVLTIKGNVKDKPKEPISPVKTQPEEGGFQ